MTYLFFHSNNFESEVGTKTRKKTVSQNQCRVRSITVLSGCIDGRSASIDKVSNEQKAYLFRTNYNLFNCAVQLIIDKGLKHVGLIGVRKYFLII
jgi:hypothetical protein